MNAQLSHALWKLCLQPVISILAMGSKADLANNYYFSKVKILYNLASQITYLHIRVAQFFSKKLQRFVSGRKETFSILSQLAPTDETIWFHCASLGEFEQGVPIMKAMRQRYPAHKILVTFFSPSGYEVKKNTPLADMVAYLPFDTSKNARQFIAVARPKIALFIKYEIWPNYLFELKKQQIPTFLISGLFREKQIFFSSFGNFMRKSLSAFDHFFVQDQVSKNLLETIQYKNVTVSGDTRFDRVSHQIEQDNTLDFMTSFKGNRPCMVCGSTWPEDENVLISFINERAKDVAFVIAPHKIDAAKIENFRSKLQHASILYSEKEGKELRDYSIFIVDTIGYLTKMYSYADVAYVGGAMGSTGLHNILEPATFGIPVVIGSNFAKFPEAKKLQQLAGLFSINTPDECSVVLKKLLDDRNFRNSTGMICGHYVNSNTGATTTIMEHIHTLYGDRLI